MGVDEIWKSCCLHPLSLHPLLSLNTIYHFSFSILDLGCFIYDIEIGSICLWIFLLFTDKCFISNCILLQIMLQIQLFLHSLLFRFKRVFFIRILFFYANFWRRQKGIWKSTCHLLHNLILWWWLNITTLSSTVVHQWLVMRCHG